MTEISFDKNIKIIDFQVFSDMDFTNHDIRSTSASIKIEGKFGLEVSSDSNKGYIKIRMYDYDNVNPTQLLKRIISNIFSEIERLEPNEGLKDLNGGLE